MINQPQTPREIVCDKRVKWAEGNLLHNQTRYHEPITDEHRDHIVQMIEAWQEELQNAEGELDCATCDAPSKPAEPPMNPTERAIRHAIEKIGHKLDRVTGVASAQGKTAEQIQWSPANQQRRIYLKDAVRHLRNALEAWTDDKPYIASIHARNADIAVADAQRCNPSELVGIGRQTAQILCDITRKADGCEQ